ncbi:hypothetical protein D3C75_332120 [compost metagenome]
MKTLKEIIKFILSVAATPTALVLLWIYNFHPFEYIQNITHWKINSQNPETTTAAIDLAFLVMIYNIVWKIISKLKKPVNIEMWIEDPIDVLKEATVKYSVSSNLKKLTCKVKIDYSSRFFKFASKLWGSHILEINWGNWLKLEFDDSDFSSIASRTENNRWSTVLSDQIGEYEISNEYTIPFYFTVNNTLSRKGTINPKLRFHNSKFNNILLFCLTYFLISVDEKCMEIILNRE